LIAQFVRYDCKARLSHKRAFLYIKRIPAGRYFPKFFLYLLGMKPADKPKKVIPTPTKPKPVKPAVAGSINFTAILFNVGGAILAGLFLMFFFQHNEPNPQDPNDTHLNSGYDWLLNTMLKANLENIEQNPGKTLDQKYELKWGPGEILYVEQIKKVVPDTATVVLPPLKLFKEVGYVMTQTGPALQPANKPGCKAFSMMDIPWITYFLYPRKVIYADTTAAPIDSRASYLVSIDGWGLDKVNYTVDKPQAFMVLPIKKQ
jgi:hypothetical protein